MIRGQSASMITEPAAQDFRSNNIFNQIEAVLAEDGAALVGRVKGIYLFKVKGGPNGAEGKWILDAKNGSGSVEWQGQGSSNIIIL